MTSFQPRHDDRTNQGNTETQHDQTWDSVETYFHCITTCSLDDGDCITRCVEDLRDAER